MSSRKQIVAYADEGKVKLIVIPINNSPLLFDGILPSGSGGGDGGIASVAVGMASCNIVVLSACVVRLDIVVVLDDTVRCNVS